MFYLIVEWVLMKFYEFICKIVWIKLKVWESNLYYLILSLSKDYRLMVDSGLVLFFIWDFFFYKVVFVMNIEV